MEVQQICREYLDSQGVKNGVAFVLMWNNESEFVREIAEMLREAADLLEQVDVCGERRGDFDVFATATIDYPKFSDELKPEEVLMEVTFPRQKEKLISRIGCCSDEITYEWNGIRIPLTLSFYEKNNELHVYFRLGNVMQFNAAIYDPFTGKKGIDALFSDLGKEAVLRHFERVKKFKMGESSEQNKNTG